MPSQASVLVAVLGLAVLAAPPPLPEGFARLPAEMRARATVVVSGIFTSARGPCEFLPDGSRRWPLLRGFTTAKVYRGTVRVDYIGVTGAEGIGLEGERIVLVEGREYLLLLRPSKDSIQMLGRRVGSLSHRDALQPGEVVAIVEP